MEYILNTKKCARDKSWINHYLSMYKSNLCIFRMSQANIINAKCYFGFQKFINTSREFKTITRSVSKLVSASQSVSTTKNKLGTLLNRIKRSKKRTKEIKLQQKACHVVRHSSELYFIRRSICLEMRIG